MEQIQEINNIEELYEIVKYISLGTYAFSVELCINNKWRSIINNDTSPLAISYVFLKVNEGFKCRYRTWGE